MPRHPSREGRVREVREAGAPVRRVSPERGILRRKPKLAFPTLDRRVVEFQDWLRQHRGVTELTIDRHGRMVMRLLPALGHQVAKSKCPAHSRRDHCRDETGLARLCEDDDDGAERIFAVPQRAGFVPSGTRSGCANHSAVATVVAAAIHPLVRCRDVDCNVRSDHGHWRA